MYLSTAVWSPLPTGGRGVSHNALWTVDPHWQIGQQAKFRFDIGAMLGLRAPSRTLVLCRRHALAKRDQGTRQDHRGRSRRLR